MERQFLWELLSQTPLEGSCPALSHTVPALGEQQYWPGPWIWTTFSHHHDSYETTQWRQGLEKQEREMYLWQGNWQALTNLHKDVILSKQNNWRSLPRFNKTSVSFTVCIQMWIWLQGQVSVWGFPIYISLNNLNWQSKQAGQTLKYLRDLNENARFLVNSVHFWIQRDSIFILFILVLDYQTTAVCHRTESQDFKPSFQSMCNVNCIPALSLTWHVGLFRSKQ